MSKPHIVLDRDSQGKERYMCSLCIDAPSIYYWYEYGETWRSALDKMEARLARRGK